MKLSTKGNMGPQNGNSSQALLLANEGYADEAIAERVGMCLRATAYIGLNVINNHGLPERIPTIERMKKEGAAWNLRRNQEGCKINWRFTTA